MQTTIAAAVFTVWTGLIYWPVVINCEFEIAGVVEVVNFYRSPTTDTWVCVTATQDYEIVPSATDGWDLQDESAVIATLPDLFWEGTSYGGAFSSGAGVVRVLSSHTDWLRLDVCWVPMFVGILTGFILDITLMTITWPIRSATHFLLNIHRER